VAAHSGLTAFSTQKLAWGSAPGSVRHRALAGRGRIELLAALTPGDYVSRISGDLSADASVGVAIERQRERSGLPWR